MNFRTRFQLLLSLQIVLLLATLMTAALILAFTRYLAVPAILLAVAVLQGYLLYRFFAATMATFDHFISTLRHADFTQQFATDTVDPELNKTFNQILERFRAAHREGEAQAIYLDTLVKQAPVPIMALRADGAVTLQNHPMRQLLGISGLHHLDQLATHHPELSAEITRAQAGHSRLVRTEINGIPVQLRLSMSEIRVADRPERLYTLENLSAVLDEREATAWRDLIRVMTHEIMNTLTPITSLAETANTLLADSHDPDAREAVATIARRSARLLGFVERYRELLKIPDPMLEKVSVRELLDDVVKLLGSRLQGISMRVSVIPESLGVDADRALLDQVLINLLGNAIDAVANQADPEIRLTAHLVRGRTAISVSDSGPGIPPAIREQIFIPFFTTKPEGSGIGLALSRQIVRAHGAELTLAAPVEGAGATFTLHF